MLVVYPTLNRTEVLVDVLRRLPPMSAMTRVMVLDNGSNPALKTRPEMQEFAKRVLFARVPVNVGNYMAFAEGLWRAKQMDEEIVAFFHSDFYVYEPDWDTRVRKVFDADPLLGLVGFVGSNVVDSSGGRGLGTVLNYIRAVKGASAAEPHGRRATGFEPAACVDGCSMIFRTNVLEAIGFRDFPPHHMYDRLMPCQVIEVGYRVGFIGVACDHLSCRTVCFEQAYHDLARAWCEAHGIAEDPSNPGWDLAVYRAGERLVLSEYRDAKHLIPLKVNADWSIESGWRFPG